MKKTLVICLLLIYSTSPALAQKYITRTGKISFDATTQNSPEKIYAINNEVANILDATSGDVIFQVPMKSFKFERELMQEHFNENYVESDKYPRGEFRGKIANMGDVIFTKDGTYKVTVNGQLTIHGVAKEITVPGIITVKGNTIKINTKFSIKLHDYKVDVPSLVADKVSKDATINLESELTKK